MLNQSNSVGTMSNRLVMLYVTSLWRCSGCGEEISRGSAIPAPQNKMQHISVSIFTGVRTLYPVHVHTEGLYLYNLSLCRAGHY